MSDIDVLLQENRKFPPDPAFAVAARISTAKIYTDADRDYEKFWADEARKLEWIKPFSTSWDCKAVRRLLCP